MSDLSYLKKLLDGAGVEWLPLGNITTIKTGQSVNKNMISDNLGEYPVINSGREPLGFIDTWNTDNDPMGITTRGAGVGSVTWQNGKYFRGNLNYSVTINKEQSVNVRYLYHLLLEMQKEIQELCTFDGIPALNASSLKKLLIPIPCPGTPEKSLAIQSEIVRILDKFSALTAELTAELSMRKKQYNYYRDQLLSFEDGEVEWKTLGDVTKKWYSGGTPTAGKAEYYENGDIPWLRTQEVKFSDINSTEIKITQAALKNSAAKWIPENCVIIAISGATAGRSAINKIPLTTNQHCGCLEIDDTKALYRYVFHWVSFNYENIKSLGQGARGDLNSTIIKNFKLPIPYATDPDKSLKEQARIVEILDKFDTLTNSFTEGLPREIELRQKQYEYYRDMLFSFPKQEVAEA
ncbi:restriction endonuclease subunit S [Enterobacter sp. KBR-315C3_2022]|uniref:restriction endonuclease subunit S n=1 Tax=Enterobacter sp. KBR-315C3_2022 TaxID=3242494 RepID=UPI003527015C